MDASNVDIEPLLHLNRLRAHVSQELVTKVEEQINECHRRLNVKLQRDKHCLMEDLQQGNAYERLYSDDIQSSSEKIRSEIEYFEEVLNKLKSCNITINEEFDRLLQHDGSILQCGHLTDSEDDTFGINRALNKESDVAIDTGLSNTAIKTETRSASLDNEILIQAYKYEFEETREHKGSDFVEPGASGRNQPSVYISSDEERCQLSASVTQGDKGSDFVESVVFKRTQPSVYISSDAERRPSSASVAQNVTIDFQTDDSRAREIVGKTSIDSSLSDRGIISDLKPRHQC